MDSKSITPGPSTTPEPPEQEDYEPISRGEWAALIMMGFGLVAALALAALRAWRCEAGAVGLVWAGAYLMGQISAPASPHVIHHHNRIPPRGT